MSLYNSTLEKLFALKDEKYADFSGKIAKSNKRLIGVRIPLLKSLAKDILKGDYLDYLKDCKFEYFEDTLLYGLIISKLTKEEFFEHLEIYLSNADSWSHIDSFVPEIKFLKKNKGEFYGHLCKNIKKAKDFKLRFYIVCLMDYFLEEEYLLSVFNLIQLVDGRGYYNDMAIAWLISVAMVKFERQTLDFIENCKLSAFTLNKSISKIRDSFRVSPENKVLVQKFIRKIQ